METKERNKFRRIVGDVRHAVDDKGRVIVPARWRAGIGTDFYVSPHPDGALVVMTEDEFEEVLRKADACDATEVEKSHFKRYLSSHTHVTQMDRQGRINLTESLMHHGSIRLGVEVVLVGRHSRFEIYNVERWKQMEEMDKKGSQVVTHKIGF